MDTSCSPHPAPLQAGEGQGEGGPERVQRLDFPHPSPLPGGEGVLTWRLCPFEGECVKLLPGWKPSGADAQLCPSRSPL